MYRISYRLIQITLCVIQSFDLISWIDFTGEIYEMNRHALSIIVDNAIWNVQSMSFDLDVQK